MSQNAALTEKMVRLLDEHPREARDSRISATMCGEMAVMRLLYTSEQDMTAGELSSKLCMTTSRIAAVLNSLEKKGWIERRNDTNDRRRVLVSLTEIGKVLCEGKRQHLTRKISLMLSMLGDDAPTFVRLVGRVFEIVASPEFKQFDCMEKEDLNG